MVDMEYGEATISEEPVEREKKYSKEDNERKEKRLTALFKKYQDLRKTKSHYRGFSIEQIWEVTKAIKEGTPPRSTYPNQTVYMTMEGFRIVETLKPLLSQGLFPDGQKFTLECLSGDKPEDAQDAQMIAELQIGEDGFYEASKWTSDSNLDYGIGIVMYGWQEKEENKRLARDFYAEDDDETTVKGALEARDIRKPFIRNIDPRNVWADPFVEDIQESSVVFVLDYETAESIAQKAKDGIYDATLVKEFLKKNEHGKNFDSIQNKRGETTEEDVLRELSECVESFPMLHAYDQRGKHCVLADMDCLILSEDTPTFKPPFLNVQNFPMQGRLYGLPEIFVVMDQLRLLSDVQSLMMDSALRNLNPSTFIAQSERNLFMQQRKIPGGTLFLQNVAENVGWAKEPTNDISSNCNNLLDFIREDVRQSTGNTLEQSGSTNQRSAAGIRLLINAAQARLWYKQKSIRVKLLRLYGYIYELLRENLDDDFAVRVSHEGKSVFRENARELFTGEVVVKISTQDQVEDPIAQQARLQALFAASVNLPFVNVPALWRDMVLQHKLRNPDKYMLDMQANERTIDEDINAFAVSGVVPPFSENKSPQLVLSAWGRYVQTPEFLQKDPVYQSRVYDYLTENDTYLIQLQQQAQQAAQTSLGQGGMPPDQESAQIAQDVNQLGTQGAEQGGIV